MLYRFIDGSFRTGDAYAYSLPTNIRDAFMDQIIIKPRIFGDPVPGNYISIYDDDGSANQRTAADFMLYNTITSTIYDATPNFTSVNFTPGRTVGGAAFQPSPDRMSIGIYSVRMTAGVTLAQGARVRVDCPIGPTSAVASGIESEVAEGLTGSLVVGVNLNDQEVANLIVIYPPGWYGKLVATQEVAGGTATFAIDHQVEFTL